MNKENKKTFDWDDRKISQFIVWDYIENMEKINFYDVQNLLTNDFLIATSKYKKYKIIIDLIDNVYNNFFLKLTKGRNIVDRKILFDVRVKYPSIIVETKKNYLTSMIVRGRKDRLFATKNFIKYKSFTDLYQFVYNYLTQKNEHYLYALIKNIEEKIRTVNPDYIVLWNDSLPIERAIVLVSRKLGIITIDIQHGIYQSTSVLTEERAADYVMVWGQYFKDLYVKNGVRKPEEVYVLGYPYLIKRHKSDHRKKRHYAVCYLGEDFERYNKDLLDIKLETISNLYKICNHLGLKFIYRPHPGDDRRLLKSKLPDVYFTQEREKIDKTFREEDVFISFNSTALIEAAIRSKVCLQLMNFPMKTDDFEELGVCSKAFKTIEEIENYLTKIANSPNLDDFKPKFNNHYVDLSYNPGKRFLEILDDIEKNKK